MKLFLAQTRRALVLPLVSATLLVACGGNETEAPAPVTKNNPDTTVVEVTPEPAMPKVTLDAALEDSLCQAFRDLPPRAGLSEPCRVAEVEGGFTLGFPSKTITVPVLSDSATSALGSDSVGSQSEAVSGGYTNTAALAVVSEIGSDTCVGVEYSAPDGFSDSFILKSYPGGDSSIVALASGPDFNTHQIAVPSAANATVVLAMSPREPNLTLRAVGLQRCEN